MTSLSINREKKILELLQKQDSASIQELVDALGVSNMTIHRDLNKLADTGQIQKKHGGVTLAGKSSMVGEDACAMCKKTVSGRSLFIVQLESGEQKRACCAHCGLMLQTQTKNMWQSFTVDYLHGHTVSASQAVYVLGSDLNICCIPSVLSFGSPQEAEKFQKGFGGRLVNMQEAIHYLQK